MRRLYLALAMIFSVNGCLSLNDGRQSIIPPTRQEAPQTRPPLPIMGTLLNDVFQMRAEGQDLYVGYLRAKKGTELGKIYEVFRLNGNLWTSVVREELGWGEGIYNFLVRAEGIYFLRQSSSQSQLYFKPWEGTAVPWGESLLMPQAAASAANFVDLEFDRRGHLYFGYFEGSSEFLYHLYQFDGASWRDLSPQSPAMALDSLADLSGSRGIQIDGSDIYLFGSQADGSRDLVVLQRDHAHSTWVPIFQRPKPGSPRTLKSVAFDSQNGNQTLTAVFNTAPEFSGFYSRSPGAPWGVDSEEASKPNSPWISIQRVFAKNTGNVVLTASAKEDLWVSVPFTYRANSAQPWGTYVLGRTIGGSASAVIFQNHLLVAHSHPTKGFILSDLGVMPE